MLNLVTDISRTLDARVGVDASVSALLLIVCEGKLSVIEQWPAGGCLQLIHSVRSGLVGSFFDYSQRGFKVAEVSRSSECL